MNGYRCKEMQQAFDEDDLLGIGYAYMIIATVGSLLNILAIYCFWKTRTQRRGSPSNQLLSLNVYVILPLSAAARLSMVKNCVAAITYISLNAFGVWYSSFLIILITLHRYLKVTKFARLDVMASRDWGYPSSI